MDNIKTPLLPHFTRVESKISILSYSVSVQFE